MLIVSISVYVVDTFTAINLLAFDRWAGQIKPEIPLTISRWIFAGCIILSFLLLFYRWMRAIRVMRKGGVAQSYLDPLAIRIQSIRTGDARGWKRFLVFAELTKSKKGADYVALFAYYSFEAWLRICFAEGPRQVLNAITLYTVMRLNLLPQGDHAATNGHSPIIQFFVNVGILASSNRLQAIVLFGMLWTLIIWVISAISLMISTILYLVFLWHHIPSADGSLRKYCKRKINRRMERIVKAKTDTAVKKENEIRQRQEAKAGIDFKRQPTLPDLGSTSEEALLPLSRQTTMTTLPEYSARPNTARGSDSSSSSLPLSAAGRRPPPPSRGMTHTSEASWSSYTSNAPLMNSAGDPGRSFSEPLQTPNSASPSPWSQRPPPVRNMTGLTQPGRPFSPASGPGQAGVYQMEALRGRPSGPSSRNVSDSSVPIFASRDERSTSRQQNPYFPPLPGRGPAEAPLPSIPQWAAFDSNGRSSSPAPSYHSQNPYPRSYTPNAAPNVNAPRPQTNRQPQLPPLQTSVAPFNQPSPSYRQSPSSQSIVSPQSRPSNRPYPVPAQTPQSAHSQYPPRQASAGGRLGASSSDNRHDSFADILDGY